MVQPPEYFRSRDKYCLYRPVFVALWQCSSRALWRVIYAPNVFYMLMRHTTDWCKTSYVCCCSRFLFFVLLWINLQKSYGCRGGTKNSDTTSPLLFWAYLMYLWANLHIILVTLSLLLTFGYLAAVAACLYHIHPYRLFSTSRTKNLWTCF